MTFGTTEEALNHPWALIGLMIIFVTNETPSLFRPLQRVVAAWFQHVCAPVSKYVCAVQASDCRFGCSMVLEFHEAFPAFHCNSIDNPKLLKLFHDIPLSYRHVYILNMYLWIILRLVLAIPFSLHEGPCKLASFLGQ